VTIKKSFGMAREWISMWYVTLRLYRAGYRAPDTLDLNGLRIEAHRLNASGQLQRAIGEGGAKQLLLDIDRQ
jgi:hypothetical protein